MDYILSVIIPVYNVEKYVAQCIDSVLSQTLKNIEIVLINDGSTDNSGVICAKYARNNKNIKYISKNNEGLGLTRNVGLENATGEYIAFLDSDDYVDNTFYEKIINLQKKYNADICNITSLKEKVVDIDRIKIKHGQIDNENIVSGGGYSCVYNKHFLNKHKIRFVSERVFISEDKWFNLDCSCYANRIVFSNIKGYNYRYNPNSLSRGNNPNRFNMLINSTQMLYKKYKDIGMNNPEIQTAIYFWPPFEKCYSQVYRYEHSKDSLQKVVDMCENDICRECFRLLYVNKLISGTRYILLKLLYTRKYKAAQLLIKIYLFIRHRTK